MMRALPPHAVRRVRLDAAPHPHPLHRRKRAQRPILRVVRPLFNHIQRPPRCFIRKQLVPPLARQAEPTNRHVVPPPLDQHRFALALLPSNLFLRGTGVPPVFFTLFHPPLQIQPRQRIKQHRNILLHKLFLQRDRVGRDHHLFPAPHRPHNRRHQIRKALPNPRPRLHKQMPTRLHRPIHRSRHPQLLIARLIPLAQPRRDRTTRPKQHLNIMTHELVIPKGIRLGSPSFRGYILGVARCFSSTTTRPVGVSTVPI